MNFNQKLTLGDTIYFNSNEFEAVRPCSVECRILEIHDNDEIVCVDNSGCRYHINHDNVNMYSTKPDFEILNLPSTRYYDDVLGIDGTGDELYIYVRNMYEDKPEALEKISSILENEGKFEKAKYVDCTKEYYLDKDNGCSYNLGKIKCDLMDMGHTDEFSPNENIVVCVYKDNPNSNDVIISVTDTRDGYGTGAITMPLEDVLDYSDKDFDALIGSILFYNMEYEETEKE